MLSRNLSISRRPNNSRRVLALLGLGLVLVCGPARAQTLYRLHQPEASAKKPKTSSTETERHDLAAGTTPSRSVETRKRTDGHQVETHALETLSVEGRYEPLIQSDEQTTQVDAQTTRIVRRSFARDADGRRKVIEVTEEEHHRLPGSRLSVVRTTSRPDLDGHFQIKRREIEETIPLSSNVNQTRTTVLLPDINGTLGAAEQINQIERQKEKGVVGVEKTRLLPDGNGRWEPYETQERVVKTDAKEVRTEEQVRRRDATGQLSLTERTITNEWKDASGQENQTVETYSNNIAGTTRYEDGSLHLDRRLHVVRSTRPDGSQQTVQQLEQRSIVAPAEGLRVTEKTEEISRPSSQGGTDSQKTVQRVDGNGQLKTVFIVKAREAKNY